MQKQIVSLALGALLAASAAAQNLPAGTREADSPNPKNSQQNSDLSAAESALERSDFRAAIAALQPLAASQPNNSHILYDLGFAQEHSGDDAAASVSYRAAVAADPSFAQAQLALGLLDARNGRLDAAHRELEAASNIARASNDLRARALRSLAVLDERTNPDASRDELLAALKLTPETPADILLGARLAEHAGSFPEAEAAYRRLLALNPGDADALAGLAHALTAEGHTAEAETLLTTALKPSLAPDSTTPADPRLLSELAAVYGTEGKPKEAIPLIEKLRAGDPAEGANPAITRLLAHLYTLAGESAKAEPLLMQLTNQNPNDPMLLDDLASSLVQQQRFAEAQTLLTKAVAMRSAFPSDADWAETCGHLAFAASRNHDPQLTLRALAERATVLPNSPASLFLDATAHDTLHQYKDAAQAYRAFLSMAGGKFPDEEFQARHRLIALEHER